MAFLELVSYIAIFIGALQLLIIIGDVVRHPQEMFVMNIVWPITGLYFPLVGILLYFKLGRKDAKKHNAHNTEHVEHSHDSNKPFWQSVLVSTTHCSSGCSIGDLIGAPIVFFTGWTIAGSVLFADYVVEFILAFILGVAFQYYGMRMKDRSPKEELVNALKADTWSLIAFEIGMFGWMALSHYVFFSNAPNPDNVIFWFMMQIAMMIGFLTSYPANWMLVKKGIKHAM
ncbi:DUF4396 domain-containing protein [Terribacillus saccharophilus]|uniref:DUF4396 domain-containing protein n=1 Tax=Terribacillus saccharophilus TaxID=361277 RepID=A0AAX2EDS8_9BACI|nr:DUF4396 domain-containing protein [Terribacillus goriensis]SEM86519.1 protein of unknown function [Terribacillus saccharophilus]